MESVEFTTNQLIHERSTVMEQSTRNLEKVIKIDENAVRDHLGEMVRSTVEDTLNKLLDAEADNLCNAEKYQRAD